MRTSAQLLVRSRPPHPAEAGGRREGARGSPRPGRLVSVAREDGGCPEAEDPAARWRPNGSLRGKTRGPDALEEVGGIRPARPLPPRFEPGTSEAVGWELDSVCSPWEPLGELWGLDWPERSVGPVFVRC